MSICEETIQTSSFTGDKRNHLGKQSSSYFDESLHFPVDNVENNSQDIESGLTDKKINECKNSQKLKGIAVVTGSFLKKFSNYFTNSILTKTNTINILENNKNSIENCEIHTNLNAHISDNGQICDADGNEDNSTKELGLDKNSDAFISLDCSSKQDSSNELQKQSIDLNPNCNMLLLPRVYLKQGVNSIISDCDSGLERCFDKSGRERLASHYSTEKSGSSGYYSSHIYSTSSVDEHIYSEPVIDNYPIVPLKTKTDGVVQGTSNTISCNLIGTFNEKSTSFENCCLKPQQSVDLNDAQQNESVSNSENLPTDNIKRQSQKLPTIMEGIDGQIPRPIWPSELDDSLMDINLDSFRLPNEAKKLNMDLLRPLEGSNDPPLECHNTSPDSPTFENNYRCIKYVNSCPENAYNVEGVMEDVQSSIDKSLALYLKKYNNNMTIQNTRDFLEEMRGKLILLLDAKKNIDNLPKTHVQNNPFLINEAFVDNKTNSSILLVEENIKSLKADLDDYLKLLNQTNEYEIKQLCTGLAKDSKLLMMKKALENRLKHRINLNRPIQANDGYDIFETHTDYGYELMIPNRIVSKYQENKLTRFDTVYVSDGFNLGYGLTNIPQQFCSVGASDPNFQLKRKSECSADEQQSNTDIHNYQCDDVNINIRKKIQKNLTIRQQPVIMATLCKSISTEQDMILEWHKNKPSIWEMYYGINRPHQTLVKKIKYGKRLATSVVSYPSTRPESDFTLDLPRAEQLRIKMEKEKRFRSRCKIFTTFLSLVFFLLTVMVVSLVLSKGKRMFGSML